MTYFLAKTDPATYSLENLEQDQTTTWDGVRNAQAVQAIKSMRPGDDILIYHSMGEAGIVGLARVTSEPRPDVRENKSWVVDVAFVRRLARPDSKSCWGRWQKSECAENPLGVIRSMRNTLAADYRPPPPPRLPRIFCNDPMAGKLPVAGALLVWLLGPAALPGLPTLFPSKLATWLPIWLLSWLPRPLPIHPSPPTLPIV